MVFDCRGGVPRIFVKSRCGDHTWVGIYGSKFFGRNAGYWQGSVCTQDVTYVTRSIGVFEYQSRGSHDACGVL